MEQEVNALIDQIRRTYRLTEREIMQRVGYNEGYLSQSRSRGVFSGKFIEKLRLAFPDAGQVAPAPGDTSAVIAVLMERVAALMSEKTGRSAQIERELIVQDAKALQEIRKA